MSLRTGARAAPLDLVLGDRGEHRARPPLHALLGALLGVEGEADVGRALADQQQLLLDARERLVRARVRVRVRARARARARAWVGVRVRVRVRVRVSTLTLTAYRQAKPIATSHSTRDEVWMILVGDRVRVS